MADASAAGHGVCVIGAGSPGAAVGKALKQAGVGFDCFEIGSDLGGMWRYENDNGLSSAYRSLHIDTSRGNLACSDFPFPEDLPDFLPHHAVLRYLEAYADRFGVRGHTRFRTAVQQTAPAPDGGWDVTLAGGEARRYRSVAVANGRLWDPRLPEFPGQFDGIVMHSHHYRTAEPFAGRDVLVVGLGNSAVDIAVDVCKQANSTLVSARRLRLPTPAVRAIIGRLMRLAVGNQAHEFGIVQDGVSLAGLLTFISDVHAIGLETGQGLVITNSFYWDANARTRAFAERRRAKAPAVRPGMIHAGDYSGTLHYLECVREMGLTAAKKDGAAVVAQMKRVPTDDDAFGAGSIRADGRVIHPSFLWQVKAPGESKYPWDYLKPLATTPAAEAFRPLSEGKCPLVG